MSNPAESISFATAHADAAEAELEAHDCENRGKNEDATDNTVVRSLAGRWLGSRFCRHKKLTTAHNPYRSITAPVQLEGKGQHEQQQSFPSAAGGVWIGTSSIQRSLQKL
jgi:hypothetical protein